MDFSNEAVDRKIAKNRAEFDRLLSRALLCKNTDERIDRLWDAGAQASWKTCGFFSSSSLEEALCRLAVSLPGNVSGSFVKNSFLHVLTEAYPGGGHTQVAARWIEFSPQGQTHSVLLSGQKNLDEIPEQLRKAVALRCGSFSVLDVQEKAVVRAARLREAASNYEAVILHVHCDDLLPVLAFARSDFKRPIIFFNHADHLFWVGGSVADLVVNFRTSSCAFNEIYRNITRNDVLPLAVYAPNAPFSAERAAAVRAKLGIAAGAKIILSIARSYKYTPFDSMDFAKTAQRILDQVPGSSLVVIGPSMREKYWQEASICSGGRVKALGSMPFDEVEPYLQAADLVLDSFPFNSFTALFDVAKYNVPTLSLRTPIGETDTHTVSGVSCHTQDELVEKAVLLLKNPPAGDTAIYQCLKDNQFPDGFKRRLADLYTRFPQEHHIWPLEKLAPRSVIALERFVEKNNMAVVTPREKRKFWKHILFSFKWGRREQLVRFLGITFYSRRMH